ncbi:hypothetical protein ZIOFF_071780 [Zingiber officinale]|uniref:Uncharacterized protein n=1 Tax=Zingiber officinale TaxID=94328 RepID=A0A8J5EQR7_ZINOF|nr:hypothetical protein ZIOFF_071780 [Zingiber officinale]
MAVKLLIALLALASSRKGPLFRGTDDINQLECIVNVLGVKGDGDLNFVGNEHARKYIKSLPQSLGHPYTTSFYDPLFDHVVDGPVDLGFDDDVEEDTIKEMMWEEMLFYHQEGEVASRA